ncbi:MAG: hypothetical protein RIS88_507, partial [Pseudomonadota bacterium]
VPVLVLVWLAGRLKREAVEPGEVG